MENELRKMYKDGKKSKDIEKYLKGIMNLYRDERLKFLSCNGINIFGDNKSLEESIYEQSICGLIKCIAYEILHERHRHK